MNQQQALKHALIAARHPDQRMVLIVALELALTELQERAQKLGLSARASRFLGELAPPEATRDVRRLAEVQDAIAQLRDLKIYLEKYHEQIEQPETDQ